VVASNVLSIIALVFCATVPLLVAAYACFGRKFEGFFQGHRASKKIPSLLLMLTFFVRRAALSLTLIFWQEFFWGQIAIQYMISTLMIILLQWH